MSLAGGIGEGAPGGGGCLRTSPRDGGIGAAGGIGAPGAGGSLRTAAPGGGGGVRACTGGEGGSEPGPTRRSARTSPCRSARGETTCTEFTSPPARRTSSALGPRRQSPRWNGIAVAAWYAVYSWYGGRRALWKFCRPKRPSGTNTHRGW